MHYRYIKQFLDIILSLILILLLLPVLLIIACVIKLESRGTVIFRQDRLGLNGKAFKIYKFRTMVPGAENMGTGVYSFKGDNRITGAGRFLRKTSLDELPQLINILKREMSFIGPRPTLTYHPWPIGEYTDRQRRRFEIRPGVTGWAQINGRKDISWDKRIEYDIEYVEKMSFILDVKIFLKTIGKVLAMKDNENVGVTVHRDNSTVCAEDTGEPEGILAAYADNVEAAVNFYNAEAAENIENAEHDKEKSGVL